jgi:hypothetical protein
MIILGDKVSFVAFGLKLTFALLQRSVAIKDLKKRLNLKFVKTLNGTM